MVRGVSRRSRSVRKMRWGILGNCSSGSSTRIDDARHVACWLISASAQCFFFVTATCTEAHMPRRRSSAQLHPSMRRRR
jgi:hypothetical protein